MTETDKTLILAGRVVGFIRPTDGQMQAMLRISQTISRGGEDAPQDFWVKQINRIGLLLESMIVEADRDLVDELYLTGKISHIDLMKAIMNKVNDEAEKSENKAIEVAKARVRRK